MDDQTHVVARDGRGPPSMDDGAIAGLVVGVIFAVGLLVFCFYPFIRRQYRVRRHARQQPLDAEASMAIDPAAPPATLSTATRRLSSSDSFKQANHRSRGGPDGRPSRDLAWASQDGSHSVGVDGSQHPSSVGHDTRTSEQGRTSMAGRNEQALPFPPFDGEFYPASTRDDQPGVLKGTSADYYSPDIPSEAFGMIMNETPDSPADGPTRPDRSLSRGSSLRYNVKQMFHRKSTRDRTMSSANGSEDQSPVSGAQSRGVFPLDRIITDEDPTASPTDVSPTTTTIPQPAQDRQLVSQETPEPPSEFFVKTPPHSPPNPSGLFKGSPSPPTQPAAGTVNPMDIMPASNETERSHRTELQLFVSSHGTSPSRLASSEPPDLEFGNLIPSSPSPAFEHPPYITQTIHSPTPTTADVALKQEPEDDDIVMRDIASHNHLSPMPMPGHGRQLSNASDRSTPLPGLASTDPSSHNTPSTQLDSPSPHSTGSSDFRHSASPQIGTGVPSPKSGNYRCGEPGCSQTFDQPHKLKHHQRYHSKDHKCTYAGCGKGFGTKTHLQRHINDRHEKKKKYFCAIPGCDYSRTGGKTGFPRKDNWKRHMTNIHNCDQQNLPEPVEVELEMGGT